MGRSPRNPKQASAGSRAGSAWRRRAPYAGGAALLAAAAVFAAVSWSRGAGDSPFYFIDVTGKTGIAFRHHDGSTGKYHIVETYGSGLCIFDYNGDGREDIFFLNGASLEKGSAGPPPTDALYRNDGDWTFTDVTREAGVGDTGFGLGVCAADYDGDGDLDLYISNYGPKTLYRNNGDGTFTDVTREAGVGHDGCGAGCAFLDIEGDGDLDLYVAMYLEFSPEKTRPETFRDGVPFYAPPEMYPPVQDVLYRNNGDGTFTDISRESGIAAQRSWGMGVIAADYDHDGDADIFVANDVAANFLWRGDGTGKFTEVAIPSGTAFDCNGDEQGSMAVDAADFNEDGLLDFYQTSYATQLPSTYKNLGGGRFAEVTIGCGSGENQVAKVTWGANFGDFDNDGHVDIFVAAGHVQDKIDLIRSTQHYKETNLIYRQVGEGQFREVAALSGPGLKVAESSRGSAVSDLDGDGDLDIVILNSRTAPTILRNEARNDNHFIEIVTRGTKKNLNGVGAQVFLTSGGKTRVAEVHSGRSYQSHYGMKLHFGLGKSSRVDRIEVRWPSRAIDVLTDVAGDRILTINEGSHPASRG